MLVARIIAGVIGALALIKALPLLERGPKSIVFFERYLK
jgi:hypothetical protein